MRLAFLGTPDFAVSALSAIVAAGHEVACVYSQPPAPRGRGHDLKPSPVQAFAEAQGIPVRTPASMRDPAEIAAFAALDLDAAVVVAFGQILPGAVLEAPRLGSYNVHGSLLPRWRGAAPIQRAIMAGDKVTGVQVMRMTEGLDEGPVLATSTVRIDALETAGSLHDRLAVAGAELIVTTLVEIAAGTAIATPQAEDGVTYAKKISAKFARLDWAKPGPVLDGKIRGMSPFPGAWFELPTEKGPVRVKALLSAFEDERGEAGVTLDDRLLVATGEGSVRLLRVQREGKGPQDTDVFLRGNPVPAGTRLG
ncbi:MAG: methionyl-tRNA formyltransferase [Alphaproteobacteria bacterium]|nr:methionyl-tRNA formyltransferase [Alphaproteobacteria bacterium]MBU1514651.1 methionyl-tRNA formyltransferase [Alphaproteobacteria bacterium]MBU2096717.1 methionyl-tRNA formyltransferase [Alphaproteobacteria bacterium]MBU2150349.1 methionyl-tRNA formyltransferase [Alphaproteobacteria bacterium]MBU2306650.1 methionyl-tRNA formyltransferase [Alphaproteobacteria bacterium]